MKMIHNIKQLAAHIGVPDGHEDPHAAVARLVYKFTECGCTFNADANGVEVAGYVEDSEIECPMHRLEYPFAAETFWLTLEDADAEGCAAWSEEHERNVCECPSCKEIALRLTDEEISEDNTLAYSTYECAECGYIEVHTEGLPSWYRPEKFEGVAAEKTESNEENDSE